MTAATTGYTAAAEPGLARTRSLSVAGAALAALAVWTVAVPLLGAHLLIRFGDGAAQTVGIGSIMGATVVASLVGWGVLSMLERRTSRARSIWSGTAIVVLLASLSLPLSAATTNSARAALVLMHLVVAAVLIIGLRRQE